jgi:phosphoglycerol transferase
MHHAPFRAALLLAAITCVSLVGCDSAPQPESKAPATTAQAEAAPVAAPAPALPSLEPRYTATLAQGIDFSRPGYPDFLTEVSGISGPEGWGRWTDSNLGQTATLRFAQSLPAHFTVNLKVRDFFGVNANKEIVVQAGAQKQTFVLLPEMDQDVKLTFDAVANADTIEIKAPGTSTPTDSDSRKLGIGLISLSIQE